MAREQLTGAMAALAMNDDLEKTVEERLDMFYNWLVSFGLHFQSFLNNS